MTWNFLFNLILIGTILLAETFFLVGQDRSEDLKNARVTLRLNDRPLSSTFVLMICKYHMAIGLEKSTLDSDRDDYDFETNLDYLNAEVTDCGEDTDKVVTAEQVKEIAPKRFNFNIENERLEDALNLIVGKMENYKWEINDDVIDIVPVKGRDDRYKKLLELKIKCFKVGKALPLLMLSDRVADLPEVKEYLAANKISVIDNRKGLLGLDRKLPASMNFTNLTFKDLLNKIAKNKGDGGWIVRKGRLSHSPDKEVINIDI